MKGLNFSYYLNNNHINCSIFSLQTTGLSGVDNRVFKVLIRTKDMLMNFLEFDLALNSSLIFFTKIVVFFRLLSISSDKYKHVVIWLKGRMGRAGW